MSETAELDTQKQLYLRISQHPGLTLSQLAEMQGISLPLATYHVHYLKKHDLITVTKDEGTDRYFVKGEVGVKDKLFLSLFRQETLLTIVLVLLKYPGLRHKELLTYVPMSPPLLSYYLKKLVKKGIIQIQETGQENGYTVVHEQEIIRFLIHYEPYKIVDGISETWTDFTIK